MSEHRLCRVEDIPDGCGLRVRLSGIEPVAVFRCEGEIHAVQDTCPHAGASLAEGWMDDSHRVACPAHDAQFCLRTGEALSFPAVDPIKTFAVRVIAGEVFADLSTAQRDALYGAAG